MRLAPVPMLQLVVAKTTSRSPAGRLAAAVGLVMRIVGVAAVPMVTLCTALAPLASLVSKARAW